MSQLEDQQSKDFSQKSFMPSEIVFEFSEDTIPNIERLSNDSESESSLVYSDDTSCPTTSSFTSLRDIWGSEKSVSSILKLLEMEEKESLTEYLLPSQNQDENIVDEKKCASEPQCIESSSSNSKIGIPENYPENDCNLADPKLKTNLVQGSDISICSTSQHAINVENELNLSNILQSFISSVDCDCTEVCSMFELWYNGCQERKNKVF